MQRDQMIGVLCLGGDWACAHGDLSTLGYLVRQLALLVPEPVHCELLSLAEVCTGDPERAADAWTEAKSIANGAWCGFTPARGLHPGTS
jgi:hypothetical protein